jgi:glutamine cyclotransferase
VLLISLLLLLTPPSAPVSTYKIVARYPHSTSSYTEGFFYLNGLFYEGTGMRGHSALLAIEPATGKIVQEADLAGDYFGEGIVDSGSNILQWTWQTHTGFILDRFSLRVLGQFHYEGEGWGMTRIHNAIVTSDGTATLRFRDPKNFKETRHILVHDGATRIDQLNELEYIPARTGGGEIYANVWHSDRIARISPEDGHVIGWIDLTGILPASERTNPEAVLNGIAYDAKNERLFVTGKLWPTIFEIKVIPPQK